MMRTKGLMERLRNGEGLIVAEGYAIELEARGYLKARAFVPEIILEKPKLVRELHEELVHAGSDVVLAFMYNAHKERLAMIGLEDECVRLNRTALKIAREVADETGTLMAGSLCFSTIYKPDPQAEAKVYNMFKEQIEWTVEGGADFIVGETFYSFSEAALCLKAIKEFGEGLPSVITLAVQTDGKMSDGLRVADACHKLEEAGADVVGLNCIQGPTTMLPLLREIRQVCKGPVAALPAVYRTSHEYPSFYSLCDIENPDEKAFPYNMNTWLCSRTQIEEFTKEAWNLGIHYLGLCCGNRAHYTRAMAEAIGRKPPGSRFSPDMSEHFATFKEVKFSPTETIN